ncbi:MAG: diguanylate cyclase [Kastovskya adunca ATA6-11-RM4]|jgi:diguanylate cyclase (GGDEF)-like protein|nr:diguanylate cyclase [Kastovskya adunca ATA6-11-RM4]
MAETLKDVQEQLDNLRQRYTQHLPERVEQVAATWNQWLQGQQTASEEEAISYVSTLHHLTHRLAGSSATFGCNQVYDAARTMEMFCKSILEGSKVLTTQQQVEMGSLLATLRSAAIAQLASVDKVDFPELPLTQPEYPQIIESVSESHDRLIFLVEDDLELAQDLALQISCFGYRVQSFSEFSEFEKALAQTTPAAAIVDVVFPEEKLAGPKTIAAIQQAREQPLPVLFISCRSDLMARLQAVRAGGQAYFSKPIEVGELIDALDHLTARKTTEPYRILAIEDDASLAAYYALTLQKAGMVVDVVTDPLEVMLPLIEFRPDLILMDMYMPGCDGLELAALIRQQPAYVGIPIVFLSRETDFNKQLTAIALGGDDFLTKPIHPHHLIASIIPRVQRSRLLRSLMVCDSLTGLLNHTAVKEQLSTEVKRASRQQTPLAFAMIDIDGFKNVNDNYGHLTGDRVLKSLSRLLQQRLRSTDIKGRYGGEEFAIILPNTDGANALEILDQMRSDFAQVRQQAEGTEFSVTFSCGIATFSNYTDATQLNEAADRALYEAKNQGRNRVVLGEV